MPSSLTSLPHLGQASGNVASWHSWIWSGGGAVDGHACRARRRTYGPAFWADLWEAHWRTARPDACCHVATPPLAGATWRPRLPVRQRDVPARRSWDKYTQPCQQRIKTSHCQLLAAEFAAICGVGAAPPSGALAKETSMRARRQSILSAPLSSARRN